MLQGCGAGCEPSDSSDSDNDSTNSNSTRSKIKFFKNIVQREKDTAASQKMIKRYYDQVGQQNANRSRKTKVNSTSSLSDLLPTISVRERDN